LPARRLAAFLLDWAFSLVVLAALIFVAVLTLLLSSSLDRRDPSTAFLYVAGAIVSFFLPLWFVYASLSCSWIGGTAGMSLAGVRVIAPNKSAPAVWRSTFRVALLVLLTAPALTAPVLVAIAASLGSVGPPALWIPIAVAVCLSLVACISPFMNATGRAWHDHISGTMVIRVEATAG
jgi:RDD family